MFAPDDSFRTSLHRAALAGGVVLALAACKSKEAPPAAESSAPAAAPAESTAPGAPAHLAVRNIEMGKHLNDDKTVASPTATFGLRDTIYASVATTGAAPSATLSAKWTYHTGQKVDSTAQPIAPTGPATTEFHITKRSPWPTGKYQVELFLDGKSVGTREFEIKK
ncbi:MAG TPA: hypothetical protein VFW66_01210 [Gemmatimonadales bacterium]|nr:hypothetical protein [Gemmatimonadales bacterium]